MNRYWLVLDDNRSSNFKKNKKKNKKSVKTKNKKCRKLSGVRANRLREGQRIFLKAGITDAQIVAAFFRVVGNAPFADAIRKSRLFFMGYDASRVVIVQVRDEEENIFSNLSISRSLITNMDPGQMPDMRDYLNQLVEQQSWAQHNCGMETSCPHRKGFSIGQSGPAYDSMPVGGSQKGYLRPSCAVSGGNAQICMIRSR